MAYTLSQFFSYLLSISYLTWWVECLWETQVLYSNDTTIQIYRCREIRNTDDYPLFRYETFINFLTLVLRHEERERHNFYYADCTIWPNKRTAHPVASSWTGPTQSRILTCVFFKIAKFSTHRFRAWRYSHTSPIFYLGFLLWHLWLSYPQRASVNCTQCMCTCTNTRILQSPTKPNDKI